MEHSEIKKRTVTGVISYGVRTGFIYLIGIVATGLLGSFLSESDFGIYYIVTAVIGLFTFISDVGLAAALIQQKNPPTKEDLRTVFTIQQLLAYLILGLGVALTPIWRHSYGLDSGGIYLLYALCFSFVIASIKTIPSILLERELEFGKLVIPQVAENLTFYIVAVIMAYKGFGVTSYTVAVVARSLIGLIIIYSIKTWPIGFLIAKDSLNRLFRFGAKFQLNDLIARVKDDLFIIVLAKFIPAGEMGYVGWAKRWSMFPYQMSVNSVIAITFPTYSRLQGDKQALARAIEKSIFFIGIVIFPILAGMTALALPLTKLIPSYLKWQPALMSLYFFCINIAISAISTPLTNTLNAIGKINDTLKLMLMWTGLTWTISPLAVYLYGYSGVALASAIISLSSFVTVMMVKKHIPCNITPQIWQSALAALTMLGCLVLLNGFISSSFWHFFISMGFGAMVYITTLMLIGYNKIMGEVKSILNKV